MWMTPVLLFISQRLFFFLYGEASEVALSPKGDSISPPRPITKDFFEAEGHKLKAEHKRLSCEVKSAAYQLAAIHTEFTARVAFYAPSLFSIFPAPVLCMIIRKKEMS